MNVLDWSKRHHRFFEEITRIPHGSRHEQPLSDFIACFAREHDFRYVQDDMGNIVVYKPASRGYESHPAVALQAHLDMVWEKDEGYEHDFFRDPLRLIVEGDILTAEHTTLGIDDGSGVAYILSILDDPEAQHPPIEAIFTVQEEIGMLGALAMDKSLLTASRFISLDCGGGDCVYASSLGGRGFDVALPLQPVQTDAAAWRICVRNLKSGYSTAYLDGAENAISVLYELLEGLNEACGLTLSDVHGGMPGGKIASQAEAVFLCEAGEAALREVFERLSAALVKDCGTGEPGMELLLEPTHAKCAMSALDSLRLLRLLAAMPCGAVQSNSHDHKLIGAVVNWAEASCEGDGFHLRGTLRAESNRKLSAWSHRIAQRGGMVGASVEMNAGFPAWEFNPDSRMFKTLREVFHRVTGDELGYEEVQGGIECSIFMQVDREMDMITLGPFGDCVHTTKEYADLKSYDRIFEVFVNYLAAL